MLTLKDIVTNENEIGEDYPVFSLSKIAGKRVIDVEVQYYDEHYPALKILSIEFEDGTNCLLDDYESYIEDNGAGVDDSERTLLNLKRQIDKAVKEKKNGRP